MANGKRTVWISLDQELAAALQAQGGDPLAAQVNDAVRNELSRRKRRARVAGRTRFTVR